MEETRRLACVVLTLVNNDTLPVCLIPRVNNVERYNLHVINSCLYGLQVNVQEVVFTITHAHLKKAN